MKRLLCVVLCFVLFHTILAADAMALASVPAASPHSAKVATVIARLGAGDTALVAVRLRDKTVLKGRLDAIGRDSFLVTDNDSGASRAVPYAAVTRLEGVNLANGTRVHVGGGFKAKVARAVLLVLPAHRVQRNNLTHGETALLIGVVVGILIAIVVAKAL